MNDYKAPISSVCVCDALLIIRTKLLHILVDVGKCWEVLKPLEAYSRILVLFEVYIGYMHYLHVWMDIWGAEIIGRQWYNWLFTRSIITYDGWERSVGNSV